MRADNNNLSLVSIKEHIDEALRTDFDRECFGHEKALAIPNR